MATAETYAQVRRLYGHSGLLVMDWRLMLPQFHFSQADALLCVEAASISFAKGGTETKHPRPRLIRLGPRACAHVLI